MNLIVKISIKIYFILISSNFLHFLLVMLSTFLYYIHIFMFFCLQLKSCQGQMKGWGQVGKKIQDWGRELKNFRFGRIIFAGGSAPHCMP